MNDRGAYDIMAGLYDEDMGLGAPSGDVQFYAAFSWSATDSKSAASSATSKAAPTAPIPRS